MDEQRRSDKRVRHENGRRRLFNRKERSPAELNLTGQRSSPKINLVLPEALLVVVFVPSLPLARSGGERSEPERSAGGREGRSFNCSRCYASARAWRTSRLCAAAENYTYISRVPSPLGHAAGFQNSHPANIPVLRSR